MNISNRIIEIEREIKIWNNSKVDLKVEKLGISRLIAREDLKIRRIILETQLQILKEWEQREKEIEEIIDNFDTEKYIGEYCFKASSFRKELKSKLKEGEGK